MDRFAAANCQAGIEGDLLNRDRGLLALVLGVWVACAAPDAVSV